MMKELLVLRHAKSSWDNAYLSDHERPLNKRGKADAPRMGKLLAREGIVPELIISSTAERALATAELVALAAGYERELMLTRQLYHADPEDYLAVLAAHGNGYGRVMVVGHNPGVEELVEVLTGEMVTMTTANIAHIALPAAAWEEVTAVAEHASGKLLNHWRPKEIKGDG
jgi:phosphohistidine phosphatase